MPAAIARTLTYWHAIFKCLAETFLLNKPNKDSSRNLLVHSVLLKLDEKGS